VTFANGAILLQDRKPGLFPGFHAASDYGYAGVPIFDQFFRLTGGAGLLRSGAVKNDLLSFGKGRQFCPQLSR